MSRIHILVQKDFKPGDQPPEDDTDYLGWHEWAEVQRKAGIKQVECGRCSKWRTPQELSEIVDETKAENRFGDEIIMRSAVCNKCNNIKK